MSTKKMSRLLGKDRFQQNSWVGNKYFYCKTDDPTDFKLFQRGTHILADVMINGFKTTPLGLTIECVQGFKHLVYSTYTTYPKYFVVPERYKEFYKGECLVSFGDMPSMTGDKGNFWITVKPLKFNLDDMFWNCMRHGNNKIVFDYKEIVV